MNFKSLFLLGSALFLALPVSVLLSGCGGGSSSSFNSGQTYNSALSLAPGQIAQFTLNVQEGLATGTLIVPAQGAQIRSAQNKNAQAFSAPVTPGSYTLFGAFTQPNAFNVSGRFPDAGTFFIRGQVPRNSGNGAYTLTAGNQSATGRFETASPTAAPID